MSTPLSCRRVEDLLSEHLEGTLPFALHAQVDAHLQSCTACRELRAALAEVVETLRLPVEVQPSADLAERAAAAALRAGRVAPRVRPLPQLAGIPHRVLATAAVLTLALSTGLVAASGSAGPLGVPGRMAQRISSVGVTVAEMKDRVVEAFHVMRVVVGTAFEGRVERVNDRLDDYKQLLERRQREEQERMRNSNPPPPSPVPMNETKEKERSR